MFLNNLDPTFYAMQMQNPDVLTHAQMKIQEDANKFVEAQRPEIDGLVDINTFEFIPKSIYHLERDILTSYGRIDVNDVRMDPSRNTKHVSV
jgi:hypothetical protein